MRSTQLNKHSLHQCYYYALLPCRRPPPSRHVVARKTKQAARCTVSLGQRHNEKPAMHLSHTPVVQSYRRGIHPILVLKPTQRAQRRSASAPVWRPSHHNHTQSRVSPRRTHEHWPSTALARYSARSSASDLAGCSEVTLGAWMACTSSQGRNSIGDGRVS
jgi:hypothetical protein